MSTDQAQQILFLECWAACLADLVPADLVPAALI
jgi:hypothetical protein